MTRRRLLVLALFLFSLYVTGTVPGARAGDVVSGRSTGGNCVKTWVA